MNVATCSLSVLKMTLIAFHSSSESPETSVFSDDRIAFPEENTSPRVSFPVSILSRYNIVEKPRIQVHLSFSRMVTTLVQMVSKLRQYPNPMLGFSLLV